MDAAEHRRSWGRRVMGTLLAGALVAVACSSDSRSGDGGFWDRGEDDDSRDRAADVHVDPPSGLNVALLGEGSEAALGVTFEPSPDAEAHLLDLGGEQEPVRVEAEDCEAAGCFVALDWLSVVGTDSVTALAVIGESRSEPTEAVALPERPELGVPPEPGDDEPVTLVIARGGEGERPTIETEEVAPGEAEGRVEMLMFDEDVAGIEIDLPAGSLQGGDEDDTGQDDQPDIGVAVGLATWQREAMDFARLPPEPRGSGVTIAVIDTGVDTNHPVFEGADITTVKIAPDPFELGPPDPDAPVVPDGHGTAVTSLIVGHPQLRVPGIASGVTIRAYDMHGQSRGGGKEMAEAILAAVDDGADVINLSQAISCQTLPFIPVHLKCPPGVVGAAVEYAEERGVVVVASAGNDGAGDGCTASNNFGPNEDQWPAKFPTVLAVGGTARDGSIWACSPDKSYIDVLAPARGLRVALPLNSDIGLYGVGSGTSYAAPLVSGLVAILLAEQPELTPAEVRAMLRRATDANGRLMPGVLMAEIGVVPEGTVIVDPTTNRRVVPWSADIRFGPGTDVHAAGRDIEHSWMFESRPHSSEAEGLGTGAWGSGRPPSLFDYDDSVMHLDLEGMFFVADDGSITGYGVMRGIGAENRWVPSDTYAGPVGHQVYCPEPLGGGAPYVAFDWVIPVVVGGQLDDAGDGRADITVLLATGEGAAPDQPGALPPMRTHHDTLDECEGFLQVKPPTMSPYTFGWMGSLCQGMTSAGECMPVIRQAYNDLVILTESLYQRIIWGIGTMEFTGELHRDGTGALEPDDPDIGWEEDVYAVLSVSRG